MFPWQKSSKAGVRGQSWLSQGASSPVQHANSVAGSVSGLRYSQGFLPHSDSLRDRLEPVQREECTDDDEQRDADFTVPLQFRVTGSPNGKPDLQLQLLRLDFGSEVKHDPAQHRYGGQQLLTIPGLQGAARGLESAAAILFLQLIFPDKVPPIAKRLAWMGALSVGAQAAGALVAKKKREEFVQRLRQRGGSMLDKLGHTKSAPMRGVKAAAGCAAANIERYSTAAAGLLVAAAFWSVLHPPSYHLLRCIAAALPVYAGYAETARSCATNRIPEGAKAEAAWRARHKWAAQRLANLLGDAHAKPPLAPVLDFVERVSVNIGLAVGGAGVGSTPGSWAWAAPTEGCSAQLGGSIIMHKPDLAVLEAAKAGRAEVAGSKVQGPVMWDASKKAWVPTKSKMASSNRAAGRVPDPAAPVSRDDEGYHTSKLPTLRSEDELAAYQRDLAAKAELCRETALVPSADEQLQASKPGAGGTAELALFGQADHMSFTGDLTLSDRGTMALRASYLITIFLPFILLGPLLLGLADLLLRWSEGSRVHINGARRAPALPGAEGEAGSSSAPGLRRALQSADEAQEKVPSAAGLNAPAGQQQPPAGAAEIEEITPASGTAADEDRWMERAARKLRMRAWRLLLLGVRNSGAAFIKWGQWSATREDLFPQDLCVALAELHDRAPIHSWKASKAEIEKAFGQPVEELFDSIDHKALASGSIAQVHRAVMQLKGKPRDVVVKVRHPGVAHSITVDFRLLKPVAAAASRIPSLKGLSLKESLAQFSANMTAQTDLRVETVHLRRFYNNFASVRSSVTPPLPLPGMDTEAVLVETYEAGESVAKYIRQASPYNTQIVALGIDTYLKMLLHDNFVHTDLHPGNILVRLRQSGSDKEGKAATVGNIDDVLLRPIAKGQARAQLQLILLDFGLAEELTPRVRKHFISFLHCIARGDGNRGAYHMLQFGKKQACLHPAAFTTDMQNMFRQECDIHSKRGVDVDRVLKAALHLARKHEVTIDSSYAALIVGVCVIVGFATALDPQLNLMDAATPAFFISDLTGRIAGRLYA
ncbi:hypothetical protein CVIRNUC_007011 [Coccomyxa viridis]|uniref:Protein kinase domain-containing protein n=1 Tax=Coccomyxa viridis TaxID=1274662 RepID=A0AAV1I8X6_9CHLO|nr:hypothetical protein CVIRNUC_007011 [Coccomyxa viridis]